DLSPDLLAGLERRLLIAFGITEPDIGESACNQAHPVAPVPRCAERDDLLADRGRAQALAARALRLSPPIHVSLEVGQLQLSDRESLAAHRCLKCNSIPSMVRGSSDSRCDS